jgi:hypothetical protein
MLRGGRQVLKLRKYLADGFPSLVWRRNGQLCMVTDELAEMLGCVLACCRLYLWCEK